MSRGKRIALVEWVFPTIGIALGLLIAGFIGWHLRSNYPDQQRYPSYRQASDNKREINLPLAQATANVQPIEYRQPCRDPKGHDESDLCAQWKAANAAEDNALWAKWGVGGALVSTIAVATAILLALEANRIARDTTKRQLRSYVHAISKESGWERPDTPELDARITVKNSGQTPANNVMIRLGVDVGKDMPKTTPAGHKRVSKIALGPGEIIESFDGLGRALSNIERTRLLSGERLWLRAWITYNDVFGAQWETKWCMVAGADLTLSYYEDGNSAT